LRSHGGRSTAIARPAISLLASLLAAGAVMLALAGCAGSHKATPASLALQRADFVDVSRQLIDVESVVNSEVAATKRAWPHIDNGLPPHSGPTARALIRAAAQRAAAVGDSGLFEEAKSASLTGPGAGIASDFRGFSALASRGWTMIDAAVEQIAHARPVAARFARANVGLYVEAVYDSHFALAQIGKAVLDDYDKLGGPEAFGAKLTLAEAQALAGAYSEPSDRLYPHETVKLGS
jgi:hypothetical protein